MKVWMNNLLSGWNIQRILFLIMGFSLLGDALQKLDVFGMVLAGYFLVMSIFKLGCCSGSCGVPISTAKNEVSEEVEYEELK